MARATGFNVGVDAHIDPQPHETALFVEWGRETATFNQTINTLRTVGAATSRPKPHATTLYVEWDKVI